MVHYCSQLLNTIVKQTHYSSWYGVGIRTANVGDESEADPKSMD